MEIVDPKNLDKQKEWGKAFVDHEIVETSPEDNGVVRFMRSPSSLPLSNRSFLLSFPPPKEIDWFGKRAVIQVQKKSLAPIKIGYRGKRWPCESDQRRKFQHDYP